MRESICYDMLGISVRIVEEGDKTKAMALEDNGISLNQDIICLLL